MASQKLLFLFNEGADVSWAVFNVIELMGSNTFENKRIAYVLAPLVFKAGDKGEELIGLTPNIFRKDLGDIRGEAFTASISLSCLSRICNADLA